ncbi:MAG: hypothetical protein GQ470_04435 [Gammaproteobacteria bacterium]|nr:hypothetical protein [Gammaproteobacteria bacterium]
MALVEYFVYEISRELEKMSLINQMLKDLEDRKESENPGQDSITSHHLKEVHTGSRTPLILLSLISLILLSSVIYLVWQSQSVPVIPTSTIAITPPKITAPPSTKIASLVKQESNLTPKSQPTIRPVKKAREQKVVAPVVIKPQRVTKVQPEKKTLPKAAPPSPTPHNLAISQISPATLTGSWNSQAITVKGNDFAPSSELLLCWPGKCVTLRGYRINFISPNELQISITTGITSQEWSMTVLNPGGQRSNTINFNIIAPDPSVAARQPTTSNSVAADKETFEKVSKQIVSLTKYQQADQLYLKGKRLSRENRPGQAGTLWEKALQLAPEHHSSRQELIKALISSARIVEAREQAQLAIRLFPEHLNYIQLMAQIYVIQQNNHGAITLIEDAIQKGIANAQLYAFIAALYQRENIPLKSIEYYQRALTLEPGSGLWWMGLGISFEQSSQLSDALSAFQQARNSGTLSYKLKSYVEGQITKIQRKVEAAQSD